MNQGWKRVSEAFGQPAGSSQATQREPTSMLNVGDPSVIGRLVSPESSPSIPACCVAWITVSDRSVVAAGLECTLSRGVQLLPLRLTTISRRARRQSPSDELGDDVRSVTDYATAIDDSLKGRDSRCIQRFHLAEIQMQRFHGPELVQTLFQHA